MRLFAYANSDCWITDIIIGNTFRATDANTGHSSELSLFKLHEESHLLGSSSADIQELSRILVKFDFDVFRNLTGSLLSGTRLNSAKFRMKLFDMMHGDTLPSNFNVVIYPLSKAYDEGVGTDSFALTDIGSANFISASGKDSTAVLWAVSGANQAGYLNQTNVDYITGSTFFPGKGNTNLFATQNFADGDENLDVDVTTLVSGTIVGLLPDFGFRISLSGTEETDETSRFIKRFYSRHTSFFTKQPRVEGYFDDSIVDNANNFTFDVTGTLFMHNVLRGQLTNIVSGSRTLTGSNADIKGQNYKWSVPVLKVSSGTFAQWVTASHYLKGQYSASFAIDSLSNTVLTAEIRSANSATFDIVWQSADRTIPYISSSLVIKEISRNEFVKPKRFRTNVTNLKREYDRDELAQFRVFVQEVNYSLNKTKLPSTVQSLVFDNMFYQIRELKTNEIIMAFDTTDNSTKLSYDKLSNFFDLYMISFAPGRSYKIEFLIKEDRVEEILDENIIFRVVD